MRISVVVCLIIFCAKSSNAQDFRLLDVDFNSIPERSNSVGLNTMSIKINMPLNLKKGVLINSVSFTKYSLDYDSNELINTSDIESFKTIRYSLGYLKKINNKWSFNVQVIPTISSNFESNLTLDDVTFDGGIIFIKSNNDSKFLLGLVYNSAFGTSAPIPIVSYSNKINDSVSYMLGFPITKMEYHFNLKNKANIYIMPKGFYANISDNIMLYNSKKAEKVKYRSILSGINYTHNVDDFWKISLDVGYQISSKYNLLNNNSNVYKFDTKNNFYAGLSINLDLLNKKN
ncbi:DUF6268 family outer membrane beta-barrel protein [Lutibacter sp. B1]|uniref:DUF6268 family outer membrane beta-barrel protein n=1 Tax=Lutibacter sp. B1 TaxID=2725996 RepID=UPI001456B111|nr:DUF6268 family outer membrane beta-barrel protein [Lutibacter sp. B1]NLP58539.1 hypothetical protein [Lutibacter sp. B1]